MPQKRKSLYYAPNATQTVGIVAGVVLVFVGFIVLVRWIRRPAPKWTTKDIEATTRDILSRIPSEQAVPIPPRVTPSYRFSE